MSDLCSLASADSISASSGPGCVSPGSQRSSPSRARSSASTGRTSRTMAISDLFEGAQWSPSTCSAADSRARTSATQGSDGVSKGNAADSGSNTCASFASFDRGSLSWKTSQRSGGGDLIEFSETWPRSGSMRNGIAYRRPSLDAPRFAIASGLWPTLKASDAEQYTKNRLYFERRFPIAPDLPVLVALRTPPTAQGFYGRLNPTWCEWLMGFPIGFTELEGWVTASSRKSRKRSGGQS